MDKLNRQETPAGNCGLAKKRVSCSYDTFVVKQTVVLLMNFCTKNPLSEQQNIEYKQSWHDDYLNNRAFIE
ncbi:MAG: hypothetical protein Q7U83_01710 [Daejeonella sp.]|nr:hypothetical protein [Daejeonella sp.]